MGYFVLLDCNNFFVSCERVFQPVLEKKPVLVLSSNDGCVVARSEEAKELGIGMGVPFFTIKDLCNRKRVHVFSSNFELYGDLSSRVMNILAQASSQMQVYSIDEAFLYFEGEEEEIFSRCIEIRKQIKQWLGLPTSLGVAPTKTLAKVASKFAKKDPQGVFSLASSDKREKVLEKFLIEDVWGIGHRWKVKLQSLGIYTAKGFIDKDPCFIRKQMSVMGERMLWELRGVSCLPLEEESVNQSITHSRSFGKSVKSFQELSEALATFTAKACEKMRGQSLCAKALCVYVEIVAGGERRRESLQEMAILPFPVNDTPQILQAARKCLRKIFVEGASYKKCGILLLELTQESSITQDLFWEGPNPKRRALTEIVDTWNRQKRKDQIFYGSMGVSPLWKVRSDKRSFRYTTNWEELAIVKAC